MKSLETFQVLAKIGKILSRIACIAGIVGFCGCIAGLIFMNAGNGDVFKIGGVTIHNIIESDGGGNVKSAVAVLAAWLIICAGEAVVGWFAAKYFANELEAKTPFTSDGAKELQRLGILTIAIPLGCAILADIVQGIIAGFMDVAADAATDVYFDSSASVALGVMFIITSLLCRYGAELAEGNVLPAEAEK